MIQEVPLRRLSFDRYQGIMGEEYCRAIRDRAKAFNEKFGGRLFHINSTAAGGGVAEMLPTLGGYQLDLGMKVSWLVIKADQDFFAITKRVHNGIHGSPGDGGSLGPREREHFEEVSRSNLAELLKMVHKGDLVVLHDPQAAGMAQALRKKGVRVLWRTHIGHENQNEWIIRSWDFLKDYVTHADACIFSRQGYVPKNVPLSSTFIIPPAIDAFCPKNQEMERDTVRAILAHVGLIHGTEKLLNSEPTFTTAEGKTGKVESYADIVHAGPLPFIDEPMVLQVSRWDRLKDMKGVMDAFADYILDGEPCHLVLAGPNVHSIADDPEAVSVYRECVNEWRALPHFKRNRIQLACLPMHDVEENAAIVNALQRHATVVVQKSLYEGFGLTVSEALWKGKAVVGSAVGGIPDQIVDDENGWVVENPADLPAFGKLVSAVLKDPEARAAAGKAGREHVRKNFLMAEQVKRHLEVFEQLVG